MGTFMGTDPRCSKVLTEWGTGPWLILSVLRAMIVVIYNERRVFLVAFIRLRFQTLNQ